MLDQLTADATITTARPALEPSATAMGQSVPLAADGEHPGAAFSGFVILGHQLFPGDWHDRSRFAPHPEPQRRVRPSAEGGFADWRLSVEGLVARPGTYSLADLKRFPSRTQITRHTCEEGWSAIAEWTGVPLARVLEAAGMLPTARWVNFYSFDQWADSIDLHDALHPQTLLAYGMNGRDLPVPHGAPVRLRVETQLGYKSMKFLQRIVVNDTFDDGGKNGNIQNGWSWYAGI
jgi:DMSO/TMAO reductase YedYZ molybdopterin-dependent catalytic subunit